MRTRLARHARPLLAVVAVAGLALAAWSQHDAIAAFDWSIDRWQLALSVALFAVAPLLQALRHRGEVVRGDAAQAVSAGPPGHRVRAEP